MTEEKKKEMYKEAAERFGSAVLDESVNIIREHFDDMTDEDRAMFNANTLVVYKAIEQILKLQRG